MRNRYYKYYQPNALDLKDRFGDCTIRALSKVFDLTWAETFDMVEPVIRKYQLLPCYFFHAEHKEMIAKEFGLVYTGISNKKGTKRPTVKSFAKDHPEGTFLLSLAGHVVAVKDGIYYDTWDSGAKSLYGYFERR